MSYFHWKLVVFFYRVSLLTAGSYSGADCLGSHCCTKGWQCSGSALWVAARWLLCCLPLRSVWLDPWAAVSSSRIGTVSNLGFMELNMQRRVFKRMWKFNS